MYEGEKLRVHIAALGDVGATTLMGLKLLGSDVIETIGIIDLDENRMKRYEAECNQICYPWAYDVLPKVVLLKEDELFDCDVFIFCATKGVPPVGTAVQDVRMQQLRANRSIVESYAKKDSRIVILDKENDLILQKYFIEAFDRIIFTDINSDNFYKFKIIIDKFREQLKNNS